MVTQNVPILNFFCKNFSKIFKIIIIILLKDIIWKMTDTNLWNKECKAAKDWTRSKSNHMYIFFITWVSIRRGSFYTISYMGDTSGQCFQTTCNNDTFFNVILRFGLKKLKL